jgi:ATP-dependent Clp protease ATP-binding subunit ClpA
MPEHNIELAAVIQPLEGNVLLAEALLFPEFSCAGDEPELLEEQLAEHARRLLQSLPPAELYRRFLTQAPEAGTLSLTVEPPTRTPAWQKPIDLTFPVLRWSHAAPPPDGPPAEQPPPPEAVLAYVPALGIEVIARRAEELDRLLEAHVRAALMRQRLGGSLERLVWLHRCRAVQVAVRSWPVVLESPKERARQEVEERERAASVLPEVGVDLATMALEPAYAVDEVVTRLAEQLTGRSPRSVLLVGSSGVGKTAALHELVRRRAQLGLAATPFWATSGARLVAGMSGFGMWQERCQRLWREAARKRAVLHLGNLVELTEVGKSEHQPQGIASFLRPYLARGDLLAVAECTPEQVPLIERLEPALLGAFARLDVDEPGPERGRVILESVARAASRSPITAAGLDKLDRLHRRYATYSAYPGRPLRFLRGLLADRTSGRVLEPADVTAAFSGETGLPRFLLEEKEPLDLAQARAWFAGRVIGQAEAVDLVVDLLATIKAELARPRRPLASLLFIGPTGVGKTEMAKRLAEFLFGSARRLTRFDMSEYADPLAVQRLIGGAGLGEGHLTARVREQPFAVILLDEVEKADAQFFDLLLQVLGDGRLTDAHGRLADFSNSVVILTSNLGAETYQQGGFGLIHTADSRAHARDHFSRAVEAFVRPELYNRLDRVVPFAPLDEATILHIARRQLDLVTRRDGIRYRGVELEVAPDVAGWLARRGYEPRYGARPLKRAIDRELLAPLADHLNGYSGDTPLRAQVDLLDGALRVKVRARTEETGRQLGAHALAPAEAALVTAGLDLRREMQQLQRCSAGLEMHNQIVRLEHLVKRHGPDGYKSPEGAQELQQLEQWRGLRDGFAGLFERVCVLDDETLLGVHEHGALDATQLAGELDGLRRVWEDRLIELYLIGEGHADVLTLAVFSEQPALLRRLTTAYLQVGRRRATSVVLFQYLPRPADRDKKAPPALRWVVESERFERGAAKIRVRRWKPEGGYFPAESVDSLAGVIGCAVVICGAVIQLRFSSESGLHIFHEAKGGGRCLVESAPGDIGHYVPPEGIDRRGAIGNRPKRRIYHLERGEVEDVALERRFHTGDLEAVVDEATELMLRRRIRAMLDS